MNPSRTFAALLVAGLLAAVAAAQLDDARKPATPALARPAEAAPAAAERTEDIEVLRRILNHSLGLPDKATVVTHATGGSTWVVPSLGPQGGGIGGIGGFGGMAGIQGSGLGTNPGGGFAGNPNSGFGGFGGSTGFGGLGGNPTPFTSYPTVGPFDGVYLPGHGAVFTLRVPEHAGLTLSPPRRAAGLAELCAKCHATEPVSRTALEPAGEPQKPASEWDRVRDEIRGKRHAAPPQQRPAALSSSDICEPGKLAERIVGKLAANAGHVRHLPPGEHVTVVVTFDGFTGSAKDRATLQLGGSNLDLYYPPATASGPSAGGSSPPGKPGFDPEEVKLLSVGDLHLRQYNPKAAAEAYERALARYKDPTFRMAPPANLTDKQVAELATELQKGVRDAYSKLAQARLAAGDVERASAALEMARKFKVEPASAPRPAEKSLPVPAKLIVTVTKADLDKAGDDPAAVRKAIKLETVGFPPADRKKKKE